MGAWYVDRGPEDDVVISTRVRLARNFSQFVFPSLMDTKQAKEVIDIANKAVLENNNFNQYGFKYISLNQIDFVDRQVMVEKHLISPGMLKDEQLRGVLISKDESISVMVNEEDHLRIQCLFSGLNLDLAIDLSNKIDNGIEEKADYAYSEKYGYLTCCPTNTGTGLRASVMLHLPAIVMTGLLNSLINAVGKLGMAVRGIYGEGSEARGHIFQISNQITMGKSEEETVEDIKEIVRNITEQERVSRAKLIKDNSLRLEDRVYRSYGVFSNARIISSEEFMKMVSDVRLGINMGIIKNISLETINKLMVETQPAGIMKRFGVDLSAEERDQKRAQLIRDLITRGDEHNV